jgi:cellulose biosynthesis protein BcsQ
LTCGGGRPHDRRSLFGETLSRFLDEVMRAERARLRAGRPDAESRSLGWERRHAPRPFHAIAVVSNKGGVGKTTIATNLAVELRARRDDLPLLLLGLDDQATIDRMFALDEEPPRETVLGALRGSDLRRAIRAGRHGVHYVPGHPEVSELKREIRDPLRLDAALRRSGWQGLVVIDTKSDLEILTQCALAAADLVIVVVKDLPSLLEADKVFALLEKWGEPRERARILLSLVDLRIKYRAGEDRDVLALLVSEIRRRGHPLFETFLSASPKVEALATNPERRPHGIAEGAPGSVVHRQLRALASEVLVALGLAEGAARAPAAPCPARVTLKRQLLARAAPEAAALLREGSQ